MSRSDDDEFDLFDADPDFDLSLLDFDGDETDIPEWATTPGMAQLEADCAAVAAYLDATLEADPETPTNVMLEHAERICRPLSHYRAYISDIERQRYLERDVMTNRIKAIRKSDSDNQNPEELLDD